MRIILTENINGLGQIGETKEVSDGYARNFLVPKKLAILATAGNLKQTEELKKKKDLAVKNEIERVSQIAEKLRELKLVLEMPGDEKGNLYAAVSSKKLSEALKEKGIDVFPEYILISEPIKKLGIHNALFKYYDVEAKFEVEVAVERRKKLR